MTATTQGKRRAIAASGASLPFALSVTDNGRAVARAETTETALHELVRRAGARAAFAPELRIENRYTLPLGAGFGVSGACALGAALAVNEAMRLGLDRSDCVAAAHVGEVVALSGLGDVGPQSLGGFEIRTREGPPPAGEVMTFPAPPSEVVLVSFGPRPTRAFLSDPAGTARLAATGERCLKRLLDAPSLEQSVRLGRSFAETLGLVSRAADPLLRRLDPMGLSSVAMLGDSVFAVGGGELEAVARRHAGSAFVETTRIAVEGARLV